MSTKFIGVDGFDEIKSLNSKTKYKRAFKKALRKSIKKLKKFTRVFKKINSKCSGKKTTTVIKYIAYGLGYLMVMIPSKVAKLFKKLGRGIANIFTSQFQRVKAFSFKEYISSITPKRVITGVVVPVLGVAVLCLTIAFWTQYVDFGLAVKVDGQEIATVQNEAVLQKANEIINDKTLEGSDTSFTPVYEVKLFTDGSAQVDGVNDTTTALLDSNEAVEDNAQGLYIDDTFIGAASAEEDLPGKLDAMIAEKKADYDDATTISFYNDIKVVDGIFPADTISGADDVLAKAESDSLLQVMVNTDIKSTITINYKSKVKYDKTQPTSYSKVTQKGENGKQVITYRVSYLNGVQVDAVQTNVQVIKKSVTQITTKGSKTASYSSSSSSSSNYSSSQSSSSSSSNSSSSSSSSSNVPTVNVAKNSGGFIWPVPAIHTISSGYGYRWGSLHSGIDISNGNSYGKTIVASASGTVTFAGYDSSGYGNYVIIDHGNGYSTLYGHCSALYVSKGQSVSQGQSIAAVGSTGQSTGNHCHFEIRTSGGSRLNPSNFVSP